MAIFSYWQCLSCFDFCNIAEIVSKKQETNPIAYAIGFQLLVAVIIGTIAIIKGFSIPNIKPLWPNLVLMVLLYGAGNVFKFRALKLVEVSKFTILYQLSTIFSVAIAILFLKEIFALEKILGLLLVLAGVLLVTWKSVKLKLDKGEVLSLATAACYGVAFVNDAYILRTFSVLSYTTLAFLIPALITWTIFKPSKKDFVSFSDKKNLLKFSLSALTYGLGAVAIYTAYQFGRNAAQISSLNQTSTILIVLLAAIFLRERDRLPIKLMAAILGVIGVFLLK